APWAGLVLLLESGHHRVLQESRSELLDALLDGRLDLSKGGPGMCRAPVLQIPLDGLNDRGVLPLHDLHPIREVSLTLRWTAPRFQCLATLCGTPLKEFPGGQKQRVR